jgi:outer membrane receptor for monomeric catechols
MIRSIICSMSAALILVAIAVAEEKAASNSESTTKTSGKAKDKTKMSAAAKRAEESNRVITGSYIPNKLKSSGPIANTTSPVYVIDRKAIDQTGATSVSQVLKRRATSVR